MRYFWLFLIPCALHAQLRPSVSIAMGRASPNDAVYSSFIGGGAVGLESHSVGAEVSVSHISQAIREGSGLREGNLTMIPIMLNVFADPPVSKHWQLVIKGGAAFNLCERELSPRVIQIESYPNYKVSEEIVNGFSYQFGGGLEYRINRNFSFCSQILKSYFSTTIRHTRKDLNNLREEPPIYEETKIELDAILGQIVIKYYF